MARVSGPLHSDTASGKFAGSLVFAHWKGRKYARSLVTPANPKSAKQVGIRSMLKFLAQAWAALTTEKATWNALAATRNILPFNAYVGHNMSRWQNFQGPTLENPAAESSTGLTITTFATTGGVGQVSISATPSAATDLLAIAILRDTAEITVPDWTQCIGVLPGNGAGAVTMVDTPLVAGTYHYRAVALNTDGKVGTVKADQTGIAT